MSDETASSFERMRERLEEIIEQIRSKDISLEKSLDLYEEALRLGGMAAAMIDKTDFALEELEAADAWDAEVFEDAEDLPAQDQSGAEEA